MGNDYIIGGLALDGEVRFYAAYTKNLCEEARRIHDTYPVATAALGRLLTAGAMMGAMCKNDDDVLTLKVSGDGLLGNITVTADAAARVKGIIGGAHADNPPRYDGHLDVGGAVGNGILTVIRDEGGPEPYVGQTPLVTGEIAEDITYYFATSEQVPTSVGLGVLVDKDLSVRQAGGFIVQLLPFASDETVNLLEERLKNVESVTSYFEKGMTPGDMMREILGEIDIEKNVPTEYKCNCSRERVTKALIAIGERDLRELAESGEDITLHCDFCNTDYVFTSSEVNELLNRLKGDM